MLIIKKKARISHNCTLEHTEVLSVVYAGKDKKRAHQRTM